MIDGICSQLPLYHEDSVEQLKTLNRRVYPISPVLTLIKMSMITLTEKLSQFQLSRFLYFRIFI